MESTDYNDIDEVPEAVASATAAAARTAAHLARALRSAGYPPTTDTGGQCHGRRLA